MPAAIDVDDATKPLSADNVSYPASQGAAEIRALKAKINSLFLNTGVNLEPDASNLITLNNIGVYAKVNSNPGSNGKILYGFASNVTRLGSDNHTVGGQFSGYLGHGVNTVVGNVYGVVTQAVSNTDATATLVAAEFGCCNLYHNTIAPTQLQGVYIVFKNRGDGETTPLSGLGSNRYNNGSTAMVIDSQPRGTAGEFCGWSTGINFTPTSMDVSAAGRGYALNFMNLTYDGGSDPSVAYRVDGVIGMRALQSIVLDTTGGTTIRFYFDPFDSKIKFTNGGVERWGVHVGTGQVYKNGVLQY